jgi:KDO2-lipid IV(A) lauroyltransferase
MNTTDAGLMLLRAMGRLPIPVSRALGAVVGTLFYLISAERRNVVLINLRLCFPAMGESGRRALARSHFRHFAQALLDRGLIWWGSAERISRALRWVDLHHYDEAAKRGPVVLLAPHFVGLDAGGILVTMTWRIVSVYSRQKNRRFDAAVLLGRSRFNNPVLLSRQDGIRGALRALQEHLPFYYLPDMDFGPRDAIFVPFFGVPAATVTATARLAKLSGALIVPCVTRMTASGYEVRLYPAWENFPGDDVLAATERMNHFIEERVLEMPAQYLWTHKRFKTRPPGEARLYRH